MAKAQYADMIKTVSGALTKIDTKSQHAADQKMILATHRVAATKSKDCSRIYIRNLTNITRKTAPSADELLNRQRFTAISRAIATRKNDISKVDADQAAFEAGKATYGTMKAYYWAVCGAEYDQAHPRD